MHPFISDFLRNLNYEKGVLEVHVKKSVACVTRGSRKAAKLQGGMERCKPSKRVLGRALVGSGGEAPKSSEIFDLLMSKSCIKFDIYIFYTFMIKPSVMRSGVRMAVLISS